MFGPITPGEREKSLLLLVKVAQIECFQQDYNALLQNKILSKKSKLLPLNPFIHENIMRVGGRLEKSTCGFDEKHQIILPKQHQLTELILLHEHKRLMHCGVQALVCSIRRKFWPISARSSYC
ncbi:hypothetical protein NQ318_016354 [Aromia moschata]|uniref:Integrase zinc-binding domain-containing protein n=1 Tax=Aromia moschata TaxID=1265417 RepID=A0AAV8Z551_9CUCU|nr:hypothetical protein NQ318_016354 [Aromia moschata]